MGLKLYGNDWTFNPNGEYNEYHTIIYGQEIVVFSDREGEKWDCTIDDGEIIPLEAKTLHEAARYAKNLAVLRQA